MRVLKWTLTYLAPSLHRFWGYQICSCLSEVLKLRTFIILYVCYYCPQVHYRENHKKINSGDQASNSGSCPIRLNSLTVKTTKMRVSEFISYQKFRLSSNTVLTLVEIRVPRVTVQIMIKLSVCWCLIFTYLAFPTLFCKPNL